MPGQRFPANTQDAFSTQLVQASLRKQLTNDLERLFRERFCGDLLSVFVWSSVELDDLVNRTDAAHPTPAAGAVPVIEVSAVEKVFSRVNPSKASGPDRISGRIIKLCSKRIVTTVSPKKSHISIAKETISERKVVLKQ